MHPSQSVTLRAQGDIRELAYAAGIAPGAPCGLRSEFRQHGFRPGSHHSCLRPLSVVRRVTGVVRPWPWLMSGKTRLIDAYERSTTRSTLENHPGRLGSWARVKRR